MQVTINTLFNIGRFSTHQTFLRHAQFLAGADIALRYVAKNARGFIYEGTAVQGIMSRELMVSTPISLVSEKWDEMSREYLKYLEINKPDEFFAILQEHWGAEIAEKYSSGETFALPLMTEKRHRVDFYRPIRNLTGWRKLSEIFGSAGINSSLFLNAPEEGAQALLIHFESRANIALRTLMAEDKTREAALANAKVLSAD